MSLEVDIRKKLRDFDLQVSFSEQRKRIGILGGTRERSAPTAVFCTIPPGKSI